MKCSSCGHFETYVRDSRGNNDLTCIRRRRSCPKCNSRFTTIERVQVRRLFVVKRSGMKKIFDREKIIRSISMAIRKRNISNEQIEEIVGEIIRSLESIGSKEVSTIKIGEMIMKSLSKIDQVAYIRFASVYKDFNSAHDFAKFISGI